MHKLICTDWRDGIQIAGDDYYDAAFADPPDNLGLEYDGYEDNLPEDEYFHLLSHLVIKLVEVAGISWISYSARYVAEMGSIVRSVCNTCPDLEKKHCVQTFSFYQHNKHDLGNGYRPIWRLRWPDAPLYSDQIRVESERQKQGDPRANPDGKIPSDVFDFARVVGNSKQRRPWSPTQLHEGLIERCIKLSTKEGDRVLDSFAGTGSILRVCRRINRTSTSFEISESCAKHIAKDNEMESVEVGSPAAFLRCRTCRGRIVRSENPNFVSCENGCGRITPLKSQTSCWILGK